MKRLLAYAFGNTFDHVMRVAAVLRQLTRFNDVEAHVLSNHTMLDRKAHPRFHWYECPVSRTSIVPKLRELIARVQPMLFLVDGFPVGIEGELLEVLPDFPCPCVLLQQAITPRDSAAWGNLPDIVAQRYEVTIAPRDTLAYPELGRSLPVEPLVFNSLEDWEDEVDAKLAVKYSGRPVCLCYDSIPGGVRLYEMLKKHCPTINGLRVEWRLHTNDSSTAARFPNEVLSGISVAHLSRAFRMAVAPGGYGCFHEAMTTGVPTLFMPSADPHDLQARRVGPLAIADPKRLITMIQTGDLPEPHLPIQVNGAETAARFLRQLIGYRVWRPSAA